MVLNFETKSKKKMAVFFLTFIFNLNKRLELSNTRTVLHFYALWSFFFLVHGVSFTS